MRPTPTDLQTLLRMVTLLRDGRGDKTTAVRILMAGLRKNNLELIRLRTENEALKKKLEAQPEPSTTPKAGRPPRAKPLKDTNQ